jgi:hypothetical protein
MMMKKQAIMVMETVIELVKEINNLNFVLTTIEVHSDISQEVFGGSAGRDFFNKSFIFCCFPAFDFSCNSKCADVGFEVLTAVVMKSTIFWNITPCSPLSVNRRFGGTYRLHLQDRKSKLSKNACHLLSCWYLAQLIFLTLKMEAMCSSETSVDTQQTTWRHIPEAGTLQMCKCSAAGPKCPLFSCIRGPPPTQYLSLSPLLEIGQQAVRIDAVTIVIGLNYLITLE